jgi:hypothetical protein
MACVCCQKVYCHHDPCGKYGLFRARWAGIDATMPVAISSTARAEQAVGVVTRDDATCSYPQGAIGGIVYTGFYGMRFVLSFGTPVVGLGLSYLENYPTCTVSTTQADGFSVAGIMIAGLQAFLLGPAIGPVFQFYVKWHYRSDREQVFITLKDDPGFSDFRSPQFGNGPDPHICDDFIAACFAFKDVPPQLSLIQTGRGTKCLASEFDSRGFPAISGPYVPGSLCVPVCENPLP